MADQQTKPATLPSDEELRCFAVDRCEYSPAYTFEKLCEIRARTLRWAAMRVKQGGGANSWAISEELRQAAGEAADARPR